MSERSNITDGPDLPRGLQRPRRGLRLPLVWLLPVLAVLLGGWFAVRAISEQGPTIKIRLPDADGLEAGKTKVRFQSVEVGTVKAITLGADRQVYAAVQMERSVKPFLVADTRFWIVRPRIGAEGVSGLGTLLTGAFIGMDGGKSSTEARYFVALNAQPVVSSQERGTEFILQASDIGSLSVGAPVYFRHLNVGRISAMSLNSSGQGFTLRCFVEASYAQFVRVDTRFWHASGVDANIDSNGIHVQTEAISTIISGGAAFDTPEESTSASAPPDTRFQLASNRQLAMKQVEKQVEHFVLNFNESLRGLAPGATVDFRGINIGEVVSMKVDYNPKTSEFKFPVFIDVFPERIRSRMQRGRDEPPPEAHQLLAKMINQGFRGQLRIANLLTGQLYVALDFVPQAARVPAQPEMEPMPLPTVPGDVEQLQKSLSSVAKKLDRLPLQSIAQHIDQAVSSLDALLKHSDAEFLPQATAGLAETQRTLIEVRHALSGDGVSQGDLGQVLLSLGRAADSLRVLTDYLQQHPESLLRGKPKDSE